MDIPARIMVASSTDEEASVWFSDPRGLKAPQPTTRLHTAAAADDADMVLKLLQGNAELQAADEEGWTALHWAARSGAAKVTQLLLDHGHKPAVRTKNGLSPLHIAAARGAVEIMQLLLLGGSGVEPPDAAQATPLHFAALYNRPAAARLLLDNGANPDCRNKDQNTPLHFAAREDHPEVAQLLVDRADLEAKDQDGWTPLLVAARRGSDMVAELLLAGGAELEFCDEDGWTALRVAACGGSLKVAALLLANGAKLDLDSLDTDGLAVRDVAQRHTNHHIVHLLEGFRRAKTTQQSGSRAGSSSSSQPFNTKQTLRDLQPGTPEFASSTGTDASSQSRAPSLMDSVNRWPNDVRRYTELEGWVQSAVMHMQTEQGRQISWIALQDLQRKGYVQQGSFGAVSKYQWGDQQVAVKWQCVQDEPKGFHPSSIVNVDVARRVMKEVDMLARVNHPSIVKLHGITTDMEGSLGIVMEYVAGQPAWRLTQDDAITPQQRLQVATDVAKALRYLHSQVPPIVHRDLSGANILVDNQYHAKLIDFGISQEQSQTYLSVNHIGTPAWMAPEALYGAKDVKGPTVRSTCTEKCDVYSFGVLLWMLVMNSLPWHWIEPWQISLRMRQGERLKVPEDLPAGLREIMNHCLSDQPQDRPDWPEVLKVLQELQPHGIGPQRQSSSRDRW